MSFALRARSTLFATRRAFSTSPSSQLARINLIGRLGAEPEIQSTSTGTDVIKYPLAVDTHGKASDRKTSWFKVTSFVGEGPTRDFIMGLQKGTLLFVEGDVSIPQFQDADGAMRSTMNITQRTFEVLKRPYQVPSEGSAHSEGTQTADQGAPSAAGGSA
ncbi:MAG: ssDNA-binding protein, mitochondrial [Vezdaea acicularis]|nr:MAG: ssDNA-binding protein, mitochondrial [Vezdaea acicularis]